MAIFVSDRNQVAFRFESGLYANASGNAQWIGQVQNHTIDPNMNVSSTRYADAGGRNVDQFNVLAKDYLGTVTYFPQDWRFLGFFLGSMVDSGAANHYVHDLSEANSGSIYNAYTSGTLNPFISFTIEDAQITNAQQGQNFIRTVQGGNVDSFALSASEGEIISIDVNYMAQNIVYSSGAQSAVTALTTRPLMFSDVKLHKPSGTVLQTLKNVTFTGNNTLVGKHYLTGSREIAVAVPTERNYELSITIDAQNSDTQTFWDANFIGGSTFNAMLEISATTSTGSRDLFLVMSGCKVMDMDSPTPVEGINENTITIAPQTVSAKAIDSVQFYNAW